MTRPWSPSEIELKIPEALEKLHDAVAELKEMGERAARTKWQYEESWARARLQARSKAATAMEKFTSADVDAMAVQELAEMVDKHGMHPGLRKDLAANAFANQPKVVTTYQYELDALRTLMVSHRNNDSK